MYIFLNLRETQTFWDLLYPAPHSIIYLSSALNLMLFKWLVWNSVALVLLLLFLLSLTHDLPSPSLFNCDNYCPILCKPLTSSFRFLSNLYHFPYINFLCFLASFLPHIPICFRATFSILFLLYSSSLKLCPSGYILQFIFSFFILLPIEMLHVLEPSTPVLLH